MKIKIFTNIAPRYRTLLWKKLLKNNVNEFNFSFDKKVYGGIEPINLLNKDFKKYHERFRFVKNIYINRRWMVWQSGVISQCLHDQFDIAILLSDANCFSTWFAAIICKLRKKRVIFWGHGLYGNEGVIKLFIRIFFYRLSEQHLLYERRGKSLMNEKGFDPANLYVIFNSLDYDTHLKIRRSHKYNNKSEVFPFFKDLQLPVIVFIGRLIKEKNLEMLVDAIKLINIHNAKYNLLVIGGGSVGDRLKWNAKVGLKKKWAYFTGPLHDEASLGKYLINSDLCVSPGNVGLSAIHSLSLGTPVCSHGNLDNQMPEAESIEHGYNGFYFKENNLESLINGIETWFASKVDRSIIRSRCYEIVDKFYNPDYQIKVIDRAINLLSPEV